jgi:hypothetical protein
MATKETPAPQRQLVTVTFTSGKSEQYDMSAPRLLYDVNRLGVSGDDIEAGFFMMWVAAGKPGLNGHDLTIDNARPALEAWLDTITATNVQEQPQGPPTKQPKPSRGSAG